MIRRYLRAFVGALVLTLRGQTIAQPPPSRIQTWLTTTPTLVAAVDSAIAESGFADGAVKKYTIDGRPVALTSILAGVRYHAEVEYPSLIDSRSPHAALAINAINLNDRYAIARCTEDSDLPAPIRSALTTLAAHLDTVPPVDPPPSVAESSQKIQS